MKINIQKNVPIPTGRSSGSRERSDVTEALYAMEEGDSFFIPATDCVAAILQRRLTVRSVSARSSGKIDFFILTKQVEEPWEDDDGTIYPPTKGVRVWRRPKEEDAI